MDNAKFLELQKKWKKGATITNKSLTTEKRKKAAKKGWRLRRKRLKNEGISKSV